MAGLKAALSANDTITNLPFSLSNVSPSSDSAGLESQFRGAQPWLVA